MTKSQLIQRIADGQSLLAPPEVHGDSGGE